MEALRLILSIILVLCSIVVIVVVMMQKSKDNAMIALGGASGDSFAQRNQSRSREGRLVLITKISSIAFVALSIALVLLQKFN